MPYYLTDQSSRLAEDTIPGSLSESSSHMQKFTSHGVRTWAKYKKEKFRPLLGVFRHHFPPVRCAVLCATVFRSSNNFIFPHVGSFYDHCSRLRAPALTIGPISVPLLYEVHEASHSSNSDVISTDRRTRLTLSLSDSCRAVKITLARWSRLPSTSNSGSVI